MLEQTWMPRSVLPPPQPGQPFYSSSGMCQHRYHQLERFYGRTAATRRLVLQAREIHHFKGQTKPFVCPLPGCEVWFSLPGQWTAHALSLKHDLYFPGGLDRDLSPPREYAALFEERKKILDLKRKELGISYK